MYVQQSKMRPALVNLRGPILLQDNSRPHANKMTHLGYEILFKYPSYSPNLSLFDIHFFNHLGYFLKPKTFRFIG